MGIVRNHAIVPKPTDILTIAEHRTWPGRGGVEPNVHITPDKKWVVFTGQFTPGQRHVYAAEIGKTHR